MEAYLRFSFGTLYGAPLSMSVSFDSLGILPSIKRGVWRTGMCLGGRVCDVSEQRDEDISSSCQGGWVDTCGCKGDGSAVKERET